MAGSAVIGGEARFGGSILSKALGVAGANIALGAVEASYLIGLGPQLTWNSAFSIALTWGYYWSMVWVKSQSWTSSKNGVLWLRS